MLLERVDALSENTSIWYNKLFSFPVANFYNSKFWSPKAIELLNQSFQNGSIGQFDVPPRQASLLKHQMFQYFHIKGIISSVKDHLAFTIHSTLNPLLKRA